MSVNIARIFNDGILPDFSAQDYDAMIADATHQDIHDACRHRKISTEAAYILATRVLKNHRAAIEHDADIMSYLVKTNAHPCADIGL